MKYSAREIVGGRLGLSALHQELEYLERVLARGGPEKSVVKDSETSDVGMVLRRVQSRFRDRVAGAPEILLRTEYEIGRVVIREIDLERVVTNLVENATRYAPQGRILIEAEPRENSVVVRIKDNGEGIPATIMGRVLQDRSVDSSGSGWGVGLISCKAVIESAGGWFDIEVGIERGSTVSFGLVRSSEEAIAEPLMAVAERQAPEKTNGGGHQVFVVDDDIEHGESLALILSARGVAARCFSSVSECLSS
jgi:signal transduction histidine kinase